MDIPFSPDRLAQTKDNYARWRQGKLNRPLIVALRSTLGQAGATPPPATPLLSQATCHRLDLPAADVIDRLHHHLCHLEYFGDAFPTVNLDSFGPGVLAACCGARLDNSTGNVWFHPPDHRPELRDLHLAYDPNNQWSARLKDLYAAGMKKWRGSVIMGMPDLGGSLDTLATFLPGEELIYALYDEPAEVQRLLGEIHTAWLAAYRDFESVLMPVNGAYTDWCGMLSLNPKYILQCDFSYMLGNDMFREFALDEIAATARALGHCDYHLDGVGSLPHADDILALPELVMFQWAPGAGKPTGLVWLDLYRRARAAGKTVQINGTPEDFAAICDAMGEAAGFYYRVGDNFEAAQRLLDTYSVS